MEEHSDAASVSGSSDGLPKEWGVLLRHSGAARQNLEKGEAFALVAKTDANGGTRRPASTGPGSGAVLRIVFFGSGGEGSMVPLETISRSHQVIALVQPFRSRSWLRRIASSIKSRAGIGTQAAMAKWARIHDVPLLHTPSRCDSELAGR